MRRATVPSVATVVMKRKQRRRLARHEQGTPRRAVNPFRGKEGTTLNRTTGAQRIPCHEIQDGQVPETWRGAVRRDRADAAGHTSLGLAARTAARALAHLRPARAASEGDRLRGLDGL